MKSKNNYQNTRNRKTIRLKGYDYCQPGAYFVTIISWRRECVFTVVEGGENRLNSIGKVIESVLHKVSHNFRLARVEAFVIMPNHIHAIIVIDESEEKMAHPPEANGKNDLSENDNKKKRMNGPAPNSLGAIIGQLKSRSTKRIWKLTGMNQRPIWQRGYYEHIVRNEESMEKIYLYIAGNPANWSEDEYFSDRH